MPTLRNSVIQVITEYLKRGDYCIEDFECKFPNDSSTLADITFRALPKYKFSIVEDYAGGSITRSIAALQGGIKKTLQTIEQPGDYKNYEEKTHENIDECVSRISKWVQNIKQDLISSKIMSELNIDELTENFHQDIEESIDDPESYFNDTEQTELREKLDKLQERVNELEKRFSISEENSKSITNAIEKSKKDIDIYPKGVWYKTAGNKIITALKAALLTKEGREALLEITKKLLS